MDPRLRYQRKIAWMRETARDLLRAADKLERVLPILEAFEDDGDLTSAGSAAEITSGYGVVIRGNSKIIEDIKRLLGKGSKRPSDIAVAIRKSVQLVNDLTTEENGFVRNERGWISVREMADTSDYGSDYGSYGADRVEAPNHPDHGGVTSSSDEPPF